MIDSGSLVSFRDVSGSVMHRVGRVTGVRIVESRRARLDLDFKHRDSLG